MADRARNEWLRLLEFRIPNSECRFCVQLAASTFDFAFLVDAGALSVLL